MDSIETFKALVTKDGKPKLIEAHKRDLKPGELFIRVEASPINPSDRAMVLGLYGNKDDIPSSEEGTGIGGEASGLVIDAAEDAKHLIGKKVAFSQNSSSPDFTGVWRQYTYMHSLAVIPFPDEIDYDVICSNFVNPLTACGFAYIAQNEGHKAIVHAAACSSLGKMLIKYCRKLGIPLINIVRREEQVKALEEIGAENIINSSSDTYFDDLKSLTHELGATVFFDPVGGGKATSTIIDALPNGSTTYIYGGLGGELLQYNGGIMIFRELTITTFWLGPFLKKRTDEERKGFIGTVVQDLLGPEDKSIFRTTVVKTYGLSQIDEALEKAVEVASEGKVLIKPHQE